MNWVNTRLERNKIWAARHMEMANKLFSEGKFNEALWAIDKADAFLQTNASIMLTASFNNELLDNE